MTNALKSYLFSQQFNPGIMGLWVNPFFHARRGLYRAIAELSPQLKGRLLDVGCGQKPYRYLFQAAEYVGLEVDTPENRAFKKADIYYDGKVIPFADGSFDSVICNQVLEHIFKPELFLREIWRVIKPGGQLLLTVPFVWDEHEQPWDFARYSSFGLKSMLEAAGFKIIEQRKINADIRALTQLVNVYLYKIFWTQHSVLNALLCAFLMSPFNILGLLLCRLMPKNPDFYLDQAVLVRKDSA